IESESLISIQQGIQEQCYSNKRTNDIDVTKEWYLCKFLNQISEEDKNQLYESLKKLMNDSKNKKKAFQEVFKIYNDIYIYNKEKKIQKKKKKILKKCLRFIIIFIYIIKKNLNMIIKHLVISILYEKILN